MRWFPQTISGRLALGFATLLGFLVLNSVSAGWLLQRISASTQHLTEVLATQEREARQWQGLLAHEALTANGMLVTSDPDKLKPLLAALDADNQRVSQLLQKLLSDNPEVVRTVPQLKGAHDAHLSATKAFTDALASGSGDYARDEFYAKFVPALKAYQSELDTLAKYQEQQMDAGRLAAEAQMHQGMQLMVAVGLLACVVGTVAAWRLSRGIRQALGEAVRVADAVAQGQLNARSTLHTTGELRQLFDAQHTMREKLYSTLQAIHTSADEVQTASTEIATGNLDLSNRTEQRAATLQQATSAIEQITSTVQGCADSASAAYAVASEANEEAVRRREEFNQLVSTINAMAASSHQISDITALIDSIAFQTNILALNAAVEAARAGEQGRGFAVVASEVRTLAQRSAAAAQQIRGLIQTNVANVSAGATLATSAGQALQGLLDSIQGVSGMLHEVATSNAEQSRRMRDINHSVAALDTMTQQDAAMVEQSAAAASSLKRQADQLKQAVALFQFS